MPCFTYAQEAALMGASGASLRLDGGRMPFAEPGVEPNYAPSRTARIDHLHVKLSLEPEQRTYTGWVRVRFTRLPSWDGVLRLDFDDATVEAITDGEGEALPWAQVGEELRIREVPEGRDVVFVHLSGAEPTRGLYFTGPTPSEPDRQHMAWTQCQDEDAHFVFPCHDHPRVKHAWTVELDAPAGYRVLGNGREIVFEEREIDGQTRAYGLFEQAEPMPAYLFTAVAAKLSVVEAAWKGRPVRYFVPEGREEPVARTFGKTPEMIEHFSAITGVAYPWPRYDQVVVDDFVFGGMENTACTTMIDLLLVDERTMVEWDPDRLVCHELAHQWFGDLLTCQDWSQGYLNESWATFMERVWWEHDRDPADAAWYGYEQFRGYLSEDAGRYRRPIVSYDFREPIDVFDRHLYEKGACVLNTLRTELGTEAFWAGAKLYLERHRYDTVHSRHFQRAMEDATGRSLDGFFHQWIHGAGHPTLKVALGESAGLVTVGITQTQTGEQTAEAFHLPLRLEIVFASGESRSVTLPIRERERTWAIPVDGEVATVRVDPGFKVAAEVRLTGPRPWLEALTKDACPVLASRACKALLDGGTPAGFRAVEAALTDHPHHELRGFVADQLAKRGGDDSLAALLDAFAVEKHPRAGRHLVAALGHYRRTEVADALIELLGSDEKDATWHLYRHALEALGKTRDPRAVDTIRDHLDVTGWAWQVRLGALLGLAHTRDAEVLSVLLEHAERDRHERDRHAAAVALAILGSHVESVRPQVVERLIEMLAEPGYRSQLAALGALAKLGDAKALGPLARLHASAPDGRTRRMAYEAMVAVRKGRTSDEGLASLHRRLDALTEANAKLRERLDKLEPVDAAAADGSAVE